MHSGSAFDPQKPVESELMASQPQTTMGDSATHKSLEEMLNSDVDESAISAIVGSLENSLESSVAAAAAAAAASTSQSSNPELSSAESNNDSSIYNNTGNVLPTSTPPPVSMNSNSYANSNHLSSPSVAPTSTAAQSNNSTISLPPSDVGKRILLSANSQSVNTSISSLNQASLQKLSSLTNGTMTPPQSPSVMSNTSTVSSSTTTTPLQQQQTIPVGQQVALVTSQTTNNSVSSPVRSSTPQSAIPPPPPPPSSQIVIAPNNKLTTVAQKSNPATMVMATPSQSLPGGIRPSSVQLTNTSIQSSQPANVLTPAPVSGTGIVLGPRQQQPIQLQQLSNAPGGNQPTGHNPNNIQLQFVNVNSPSRPTLSVPPAVSGTSVAPYSNANMLTGTNVTNMGNQKPGGGQLAPRVVQLPPNVRLSPQLVRPNTPNFSAPIPNIVRAGTIFVKTENGQIHMLNVSPQTLQTTAPTPTTLRLQVPTAAAASAGGTPTGPTPTGTVRTQLAGNQIVVPVSLAAQNSMIPNKAQGATFVPSSQHAPLTVHTTAANSQAASSAPSQMSPSTAKKKCKNFLSTLIRLASDQPDNVASNVKALIQGLIDDTIQPEDFTNQLQRELNSSPQPCLVPFLRKSLPYLRYSLMKEELTIEGVQPPPASALSLSSFPLSQIHHMGSPVGKSTVRQIGGPPGQPIVTNMIAGAHGPAQHVLTQIPPNSANLTPLVLSNSSSPLLNNVATSASLSSINTALPHGNRLQAQNNLVNSRSSGHTTSSSKSKSSKSKAKDKADKKNAASAGPATAGGERTGSSFRDDDDINDVAAMGGVNLQEESQRILAGNAEIIGQQIRSCKDENFLYTTPLYSKINNLVKKFELKECSQDVVSLISHAAQERLKTLVEKLGTIAEHRQETNKNNPNFELVQDVKAQVQFLQELDRIEKRRHEEQEREVLIKAAKSRSKVDDPDHIAIKARAKEMQRQEMEEIRQREANETALQAIGSHKKRLKTNSSGVFNSSAGSNIFGSFTSKPIKRIKRVTMKDVYILMENEKDTVRSHLLYKTYAR